MFSDTTHCEKLNDLLVRFGQLNEHLRDAKNADGQCFTTADKLATYLNQAGGFDAWVPKRPPSWLENRKLGPKDRWPYQATPEMLGYTDRTVPGWASHYWCVVKADSHYYAIDFTAAQYGYGEFPRIREGNKKDDFIRPCPPKVRMITLPELDNANRRNNKIAA